MGLTRQTIRSAIRTYLNEPSAKFFTDADINFWIDEGSRDISLKTLCVQGVTSINTVSGTPSYVYPTTLGTTAVDTIGIKLIVDSSELSLQYVSPDLMGRVGASQRKWTDWGRRIWITPTPTAIETLSLFFWYQQGAATGVLQLPAHYHYLIILYAVSKGFIKRRDYVAATAILQQYETQMERIMNTISRKFAVAEHAGSKIDIKDQTSAD